MSYLNYIKGLFPDYQVTDELNFEYLGRNAIVIKYLNGSNYRESIVQPIQLVIYTTDVSTARAALDVWTKQYNNTDYLDGFDYVKQFYSTPMVLGTFSAIQDNYTSQILVSGTLMISENISQIKKVVIDGHEYETAERRLHYITIPDTQRQEGSEISGSYIKQSIMKFTCSKVNKGDVLGQKLRNMRLGEISKNTTFVIKLTFSDNDTVEEYTMRLDSQTLDDINSALPTIALSFIE